jgi:hypothetical protein
MRKVTALGSIAILLLAVAGCGTSSDVTQEDAKQAFIVGFVSVFAASMGLAMGQPVDGVSMDEGTNELTLDGFSIADLVGEDSGIPYTSISGSSVTNETSMVVNLTMEGGPVETIEFTMTADQMQNTGGFTVTVTANGEEMELEITESDLMGE